ncbi:MAG: methyltransferase domain-containing protein [Acidobacteria bacterium]|nr:methyltransferase domain-containing protein [Acidobacteriota bacterium]
MPRLATLRSLAVAVLFAGCGAANAEESARIVEVLALEPGMTAADVGAGDGEWAVALSEAVGAEGTVYATEIEDDLVVRLGELGLDHSRANIVAVRGDAGSTGLDPACCDAILLRMVYHHFTDPEAMRASLLEALRPGGRIAVIDIVPQTSWRKVEGVPARGGHGIAPADLVAEMVGAGFGVEATYRDWRGGDEDRYCVVFTAPVAADDS